MIDLNLQIGLLECNGHDPDEIDFTISKAQKSNLPSFISCKTVIGFGSPNKLEQLVSTVHLRDEEIKLVRELFDWDHKPFDIPQHIIKAWQWAKIVH